MVECSIVIVLSLAVVIYSVRSFRAQQRQQQWQQRPTHSQATTPAAAASHKKTGAISDSSPTSDASVLEPPTLAVRLVDSLCVVLLAVSLGTILYHKWRGNKLAYLLQPCHVSHLLLLCIMLAPRESSWGGVAFGSYSHLLIGPLLGMVGVDLECYPQPFEALNWGVQHALLLLVPLHLVLSRRFAVARYSGPAFFAASFFVMCLFHYAVLVPVSLLSGTNLNYMLCPPAGTPLAWFGKWYRPPTLLICATGAWLLRYVALEAFMRACGIQEEKTPSAMNLAQVAERSLDTNAADKAAAQEGLRLRTQRQPTAAFL